MTLRERLIALADQMAKRDGGRYALAAAAYRLALADAIDAAESNTTASPREAIRALASALDAPRTDAT